PDLYYFIILHGVGIRTVDIGAPQLSMHILKNLLNWMARLALLQAVLLYKFDKQLCLHCHT
ncbi:hypothetical protein ACJX0J_018541, partial [Zea mays]